MALKNKIPMEQLISRQFRLWERTSVMAKLNRGEHLRPCLTISREVGSGGEELAQRLAKRLEWEFFDREIVNFIAENAHVQREMVEMFDERTQNEIHNWVLTLLDRHALGSDKYFKHLVMTITTIGQHGHAIILGRGANFILPPEKALRVKIVAPLKDRVLNLMKQQAIDKRLAQEMLNQAEKERHAFIRRFFHHEVEEPWNYDLILNLGSIGLAAAEEIVIHSLRAKFPAKNNRRTVPCQEKS